MSKNIYKISHLETLINKGLSTKFIDQNSLMFLKHKLNKNSYNIYYPYEDADKVIVYKKEIPKISIIEIKSYNPLTHQQILGSLYSLNISDEFWGDIIIENNRYYLLIMDEIKDYLIDNLSYISNNYVELIESDFNYKDFKRKYIDLELIVSSLRIDNVISKIINTSRGITKDKISNNDVILNYEVLRNDSYVLKDNDIFSIRKYGKYKYIGVKGNTRSNKLVIKLLKYN